MEKKMSHPRLMSERHGAQTRADLNLVVPQPHESSAMRIRETASTRNLDRSRAVSQLIGAYLRPGDVDSTMGRSIRPTTPGIRTSKMATPTTTTRTTSSGSGSSADPTTRARHAGFTFAALVQAYYDCRQHKRNTNSAREFEIHLESNLGALFDELVSGEYRPGQTICFVIEQPKPREVWAADFRDRVVHHLLYNAIAPRFQAGFIADSCACIPGRGTMYAAERLESKVRSASQNWSKPVHYLKMDLANFFVSVDKRVLWEQLQAKITEPHWLWLAGVVLWHDPRDNYELRGKADLLRLVPAHKRLTNQPAHLGLPIGNLSSQFFANVYLNALDQFVKHRLRCKHYIRYVDDFVLLHEDPAQLTAWQRDIEAWLPANLGARHNPTKTIRQPVDRGVDFVGQVIQPWRRTVRRRSLNNAIQRIKTGSPESLFETINSYYGLLTQASHSHNDRVRLSHAVLSRGHVVSGDLTKTYRRAA